MENFFIINVPHNKHGYSLAVRTTADEYDVIDLVLKKGLFEENIDAEYAEVVEMDDEDIEFWGESIVHLE